MTENEILTVVVGLVAGWLLVSKLLKWAARNGLETMQVESPLKSRPMTSYEVLGISEGVGLVDIHRAYGERMAELADGLPLVMTQGETDEHDRQVRMLNDAYQTVLARWNRPSSLR